VNWAAHPNRGSEESLVGMGGHSGEPNCQASQQQGEKNGIVSRGGKTTSYTKYQRKRRGAWWKEEELESNFSKAVYYKGKPSEDPVTSTNVNKRAGKIMLGKWKQNKKGIKTGKEEGKEHPTLKLRFLSCKYAKQLKREFGDLRLVIIDSTQNAQKSGLRNTWERPHTPRFGK